MTPDHGLAANNLEKIARRNAGLPIPTPETVFEVTAKGRVHKVVGAKPREWIAKERTQRKGPAGHMFGKRAVMG